jgi:tetratricopeptide (TPR) repeat protein
LFSESLNFNKEDPGVIINQGDCLRRLGDQNGALNNYLLALEKSGKVTPVLGHRLGYAYHSQGVRCYNSKKYNNAIEMFTKAIQYYPFEANFFIDRATTFVIVGLMKKAEKDYYTAHQIDPNNVEALNYVGKFNESSSKPYRNVIVLNNDD